jgi:UDP-N-acetylmuramoylalanine-D-glutamate ligase
MSHARDLKGKRVVVLGLARQGIALARFLAEQGAQVTVSDVKTADQLAKRSRAWKAFRPSTCWAGIPWNCWTAATWSA